MSGEIDRFDKPRKKVTILGAADTQAPAKPQIVDRKTKQERVNPEIVVHHDEILEDDKIRIVQRAHDAPQVRIRTADKKAWAKVKRLDD